MVFAPTWCLFAKCSCQALAPDSHEAVARLVLLTLFLHGATRGSLSAEAREELLPGRFVNLLERRRAGAWRPFGARRAKGGSQMLMKDLGPALRWGPLSDSTSRHRATWATPQSFKFPALGLEVLQFPLLVDNYGFLLRHGDHVIAVDLPEGCAAEYWERAEETFRAPITDVLITHWHWDHMGGWLALRKLAQLAREKGSATAPPRLFGSRPELPAMVEAGYVSGEADFERLLADGDKLRIGDLQILVKHLPGHTRGHIGFFFVNGGASGSEAAEEEDADGHNKLKIPVAFTGDVLFPLGCGRLFEGSFRNGYDTMQKLQRELLRDEGGGDTQIFCAHEYMLDSAQFHLAEHGIEWPWEGESTESEQCEEELLVQRIRVAIQRRESNLPTVPFSFQEDYQTNLFLRESDPDRWRELRQRRNNFNTVRPWPRQA